jgi:hypothetical protein
LYRSTLLRFVPCSEGRNSAPLTLTPMITVVNEWRSNWIPKITDVRINQGVLANPYSDNPNVIYGVKVASRQAAMDGFRHYLQRVLNEGKGEILKALQDIWELSRTQEVVLVCRCKPYPCHGDIIKALLDGKGDYKIPYSTLEKYSFLKESYPMISKLEQTFNTQLIWNIN